MDKLKKYRILTLVIGVISLIVGASFHGLRTHPENASGYQLGCTMGIIMAMIAAVSFIAFAVLLFVGNRIKKRHATTETDKSSKHGLERKGEQEL